MPQTSLFLFIVFACNLIQMIGAFAGTMLAMPFSILLIGAQEARVVLNAVSILSCLYPLFRGCRDICWPEVCKIIALMLVGIAAAQTLLSVYGTNLLLLGYSLLVLAIALKNLLCKREPRVSGGLGVVLLLAAGLIHGLFISGGSLLVIYALDRFRDKEAFRASLSAVWLVLNGSMIALHGAQGLLTPQRLGLIALALPFALLGDAAQRRIDGRRFRLFANGLLLLSGAVLLFNCLSG